MLKQLQINNNNLLSLLAVAPLIKLPKINEVKQRLGNTLSLYCSATAWPYPSIKWLLGEEDVVTSIRHFITNGNRQLIVYDVNVSYFQSLNSISIENFKMNSLCRKYCRYIRKQHQIQRTKQ